MKKFNFRLDKLLGLRSFEEYLEKVKLGKVNEEVEKIKDQINELNKNIDLMYVFQEEESKKGMISGHLSLYDYSFRSYRNHMLMLEKKLAVKNEEYEKQLQLFIEKRNKVRMLETLKEKKKFEYHREAIYKEENEIDAIVSMRSSFKPIGGKKL